MKLLHTTGFFNPVALLDETKEEKKSSSGISNILFFFSFFSFFWQHRAPLMDIKKLNTERLPGLHELVTPINRQQQR